MCRYSFTLVCLSVGLLSLCQPLQAAESNTLQPSVNSDETEYSPYIALMFDYIPSENNLYGITIAPYHFDESYQQWGYYLGYARSQEATDLAVPEPAQAHFEESLWHFGLSYSLTPDLSFYAGASSYVRTTSYTTGIAPKIADGKPVWEEDETTQWGAEAGLRYRITEYLIISAGYNSSTESALISIGYTG